MIASESGYDESVPKKKKRKYYLHPIDQLHEDLDVEKKADKKVDNFVWGIWAIFIVSVCFLIPLFDIGSEMIKCGSIWFKC